MDYEKGEIDRINALRERVLTETQKGDIGSLEEYYLSARKYIDRVNDGIEKGLEHNFSLVDDMEKQLREALPKIVDNLVEVKSETGIEALKKMTREYIPNFVTVGLQLKKYEEKPVFKPHNYPNATEIKGTEFNYGVPLDLKDLAVQQKMQAYHEFAEGSENLEKALIRLNENGLPTYACCRGDNEHLSAYVAGKLEKEQISYMEKLVEEMKKTEIDFSIEYQYNDELGYGDYRFGCDEKDCEKLFGQLEKNVEKLGKADIKRATVKTAEVATLGQKAFRATDKAVNTYLKAQDIVTKPVTYIPEQVVKKVAKTKPVAKLAEKGGKQVAKAMATKGGKAIARVGVKAIPFVGWAIAVGDYGYSLYDTNKEYKGLKSEFLGWDKEKQNAFIEKFPTDAGNIVDKFNKAEKEVFRNKNHVAAEGFESRSWWDKTKESGVYARDALKKSFAVDLVGDGIELAGVQDSNITSTPEDRVKFFSQDYDRKVGSVKGAKVENKVSMRDMQRIAKVQNKGLRVDSKGLKYVPNK